MRTSPRSIVKIPQNIQDVESVTIESKTRTNNLHRKNIAKELFPDENRSADEGCSHFKVHQCHGHGYEGSTCGVQLQMSCGQCSMAVHSKIASEQSTGVHISDTEVIDALNDVDESDNVAYSLVNILDSAISLLVKDVIAEEPHSPFFNLKCDVDELSNDGSLFLSDNTDNDGSVLENSWEGYEDDLFQNVFDKKDERSSIAGFVF